MAVAIIWAGKTHVRCVHVDITISEHNKVSDKTITAKRIQTIVDRLWKPSIEGTTAFENTTLYSQLTCNHVLFTHTIRLVRNTADPYDTALGKLSVYKHNIAVVVQMCQPQEQKILCFDSQ